MPNITDYMEVSPTGGSGISVKALFGQTTTSQVGGSLDNDLYIPFGLYCSRGSIDQQRTYHKQIISTKWLDDSLFDKLFDSVSANDKNKTQKTIPATKHQTKRRK